MYIVQLIYKTREFSRSQREVYPKKIWMAGFKEGESLLADVQNNGRLTVV